MARQAPTDCTGTSLARRHSQGEGVGTWSTPCVLNTAKRTVPWSCKRRAVRPTSTPPPPKLPPSQRQGMLCNYNQDRRYSGTVAVA